MRDLPSTPKRERARATDVYQRLHVPDSLSQARLKHPRARKGVRGSGASPHYLMEASLGGSRSDSSLSSFGADSLLEAGVKAGDFLWRRVKGCGRSQHHPGGGKGPGLVWAGGTRARRREAEVPLSLPWSMRRSVGIPGCWGGCPRGHQTRRPEHEAGLGEMPEEPAQSM